MRLVVDSNCIIAGLLRDGAARRILLGDLRLCTPAYAIGEIERHRADLLAKSQVTSSQYDAMLRLLLSQIELLNDDIILVRLADTRQVMQEIDPNDTPFLAAALAIGADGIWSDDKHLKLQTVVRVWTTAELLRLPDVATDLRWRP